MKLEVRLRGLSDDLELREHAHHQFRFHLGRFSSAISEVVVRVNDINGPRGGVDKRCQIVVELKRGGPVKLSIEGADARGVVAHAAERTARMVSRELARIRSWRATG